ncbi:KPN_02809 family neutral zinc metallopeptidase [Microbaculum sp. FT89]|uniref:KPN_02809 family neutral zinc metallopeptidase n=1 Tax=Microbaculum sp. FT89 TaxID=3447298 RepID=UPI003F530CA7
MRWRGRRRSDNVEDRRGAGMSGGFGIPGGGMRMPRGGAGRAGFGGIGFLIVIVVVAMLLGINPLTLLQGVDGSMPVQPQGEAPAPPESDEMAQFVSVVLADTEDTWQKTFQSEFDADYPRPRLVLFTGAIRSACGFAQSATGPFYCPGDRKVYIDLAFYDQLRRRFQAPGDFAQAYVIAHEVGHHIQNLTGVLPKFDEMRRRLPEAEANQLSVRVELQADCYAGVWAHDTAQKGLLDKGDIEEAMNAATQIGDDAIQKRTQGYVVPDAFNHGTSAQRQRWFRIGLTEGRMDACDTFSPGRV